MPSLSSVMSWLTTKPDFLQQYTRAREIQAETQFDELIDQAFQKISLLDKWQG
jgi:hypothetical protein